MLPLQVENRLRRTPAYIYYNRRGALCTHHPQVNPAGPVSSKIYTISIFIREEITMNMFAHLKSKPNAVRQRPAGDLPDLAAASTTCSVNPAFPASTLDAASSCRAMR